MTPERLKELREEALQDVNSSDPGEAYGGGIALELLDALDTATKERRAREEAIHNATKAKAARACQLGVTWTKNREAILALPFPTEEEIQMEMKR